MGITDFLLKRKIKKLDQEAYNFYVKTVKAIEADSVQISVDRINKGEFTEVNKHLEEVGKGFETLEKIEQKYVRLKEKYKHNNEQLLNIVIDWRDLNLLGYNLFAHKISSNTADYEIRTEEIMKRFNKLLGE